MSLRLPIKNQRPKIQLFAHEGRYKALLFEESEGWLPVGTPSENLYEVQRSALTEVNCLHNHNPGNKASLMSDVNWILEPPSEKYKLFFN